MEIINKKIKELPDRLEANEPIGQLDTVEITAEVLNSSLKPFLASE